MVRHTSRASAIGAMKVEIRQRMTGYYDLRDALDPDQQRLQGSRDLEDHPGPARDDAADVSNGHKGVTETLLGMQKDGLALDARSPVPLGLLEISAL